MTSSLEEGRLEEVSRAVACASGVVFLTGAGLSVASGIAPYRKAQNAVWSRLVTDWATLERFMDDPLAWWREFWLVAHGHDLEHKEPNAGHHAIAAIARGQPGVTVITQNIDGLHRASGVPEAQLVEIHGRHDRFVCTRQACVHVATPLSHVDLSGIPHGVIPRCPACAAPLRPLVLLFDELYESHPAYRMRAAQQALRSAAVIVFVGTSFSVGITDHALRAGRLHDALLVNVNVEPGPLPSMVELCGRAEEVLPRLDGAIARART